MRKLSALSRVSSLAIAAVLTAGAAAQSFQGTPTVTFGTVNISEGVGTTDLDISSATAVIDWTPDDNAVGNFGVIAFQNSGTTATYSGVSDFAVLNRINVADPSRGIFLNGNINALVDGVPGNGSVFFYSPSGFVIGSSAVINVGSLVLSASPIAVDGNGNFINGTSVTFDQAPNSTALINTVAGSQINANGSGSYVALVAPIITHHGTIRTDTAAALVAAEAATINFSPDGLFDIQVTVGTDDPNGVQVDGGTITRNSATEGINDHFAYLVAVAKNDAVTMLINNGGAIGFDTATSAAVEDNVVILSGGFDVNAGSANIPSGVAATNLTIDQATFSTDVVATVNGGANITTSTGNTDFAGGLSLTAQGDSYIQAINGNSLSIGADLDANVDEFGVTDVTGNFLRLAAYGASSVTVGGNVTLNANAYGASSIDDGLDGGSATGGTAIVQTGSNSSIDIGGSLIINANGYGGDNFYSNAAGGDGTGGTVQILSETAGASISIGGDASVAADGYGGSTGECSACAVTGGNGTGGNVFVQADGGGSTLQFDGSVSLSAAGFGGAGDAGAGTGLGGSASLGAADGSATSVDGDTLIDASGFGGYGFDTAIGGPGRGGTAQIATGGTAGSTIDLTGPVFVTADGQGGDGLNGGTGTGGVASIGAILGSIHALGDVLVSASSDGGFANSANGTGGAGLADLETIATPAMTEASLFAKGGTITIDGLTIVAANATGGDGGFDGGSGGDAVAAGVAGVNQGGAIIHAANSDDGPSVIQLSSVIVTADAEGGQGSDGFGGTDGSNGGDGGSATGGKAVITAAAGSGDIAAGATILSASATGGTGGSGGSGDGGDGGNGGNGGSATGGFINVGTESGNVNVAQGANNGVANYSTIFALATATGGDGGDGGSGNVSGIGGSGGDAFGGASVLLVRGSDVTVGDVSLDASAFGGNGGLSPDTTDGAGGDATAGAVGVVVTNRFNLPLQRGTLTAGDIGGTAIAIGGIGGNGSGLSLAIGGNQFVVRNSDATINSVSLVTQADAFDSGSINASPSYIELQNGSVTINGGFVFQTPGSVAMWADGATMDTAQIDVGADNFVHDDTLPAPVSPGTFTANNIFLTTGQDLIVDGHLVSRNGVGFDAPGLIDLDDVTSVNGPLTLTAGSTVNAGDLSAATLVAVSGGGSVTLGSIDAATQQAIVQSTGGNIASGAINAGSFIGLEAALGITTGNLNAGTFLFAQAGGGDLVSGTADASESVQLFADGDVDSDDINAGTFIEVESTNGAITLANLTAVNQINLDSPGAISFGNVVADSLDFDSGDAVTGGDIVAGTQASGSAGTTITLGDINVGIQLSGGPSEDGFAVGMSSPGSISVGNVTTDEAIGFATLGNLAAGNLNAGTNVLALVGGNLSTGSITTPGSGRTYLADASMFIDNGGPDNFDPAAVLASAPVATGGSITIGGPVSTGRFQAAAGTSLTTGAISAQSIEASAGGLAALNGTWQAPNVVLWSNDIEIAANGGIDAGSTGFIQLVSTNATQALIGDGLTGTGYTLSNAEFSRLSSGNLAILARDDASAPIDMLIGDLSVTGPLAGSTIDDPNGSVIFATGNPDTQVAGGVIRITGDLAATGFEDTNSLEFYAGRFELDAATGLLQITGTGTDLGGEIYIAADRIHVASGTILDQLAADPHYTGYQKDLNAPAAVQRPEGVIRAASIEVLPTEALLVQNTGTAELPAGFLTFGDGPLFSGSEAPAGPIELIINGQLITEGGLLTGVAVRDLLIDQNNIGLFSSNSTINGCLLAGECGTVEPPEPPIPPDFQPSPGIQQEITLIGDNLLPPPDFGNEGFIDDNDEETDDSATSPIESPDPLFDTSELGESAEGKEGPAAGTAMRSSPGLTQPGDVDDPVSGSGNPALMETTPPQSNQEKQQ